MKQNVYKCVTGWWEMWTFDIVTCEVLCKVLSVKLLLMQVFVLYTVTAVFCSAFNV